MPTGTRSAIGNEIYDIVVYSAAVTYPTLAANASGTNTFTMPGVVVGDFVSWNMQAPPAHIVLDNAYVSAPNTITILWSTDSTGISTGSVPLLWEIVRPENETLGIATLPSSMI